MCCGGVLEVDSDTAVGWYRFVGVDLLVLIVECAWRIIDGILWRMGWTWHGGVCGVVG